MWEKWSPRTTAIQSVSIPHYINSQRCKPAMRSCVPAVTIQMSEKIMLGQPLTLTPRHTRHEPTENSTPRSQVHNSSPVTENKLTGRSPLSCIASVFNADSTLDADICDTGIEMKHKSQIIWGLQQGTPDENELLAISGTICVLCIVSNKLN